MSFLKKFVLYSATPFLLLAFSLNNFVFAQSFSAPIPRSALPCNSNNTTCSVKEKVCVCQYMDIPECEERSRDECRAVVESTGIKDCELNDFGSCVNRFERSCKYWLAGQSDCSVKSLSVSDFPLAQDTDLQNISCKKMVYRYNGHGRGVVMAKKALLGCFIVTFNELFVREDSCSTFSSQSEIDRAMKEIQSHLKVGQKVTWIANQAVSSGYEVNSPQWAIITPTDLKKEYPKCENMLLNTCYLLGNRPAEEIKCQKGDNVESLTCCERTGSNNIDPIHFGVWKKSTDTLNKCDKKVLFSGVCSGTVQQAQECLSKKADKCREYGPEKYISTENISYLENYSSYRYLCW